MSAPDFAEPLPEREEALLDDLRELDTRYSCGASLEELHLSWPQARERLSTYLALRDAEVREACAKACEEVRGGFSAAIRTSDDEPELLRDPDGPWVLNSDCASAIRALGAADKGGK